MTEDFSRRLVAWLVMALATTLSLAGPTNAIVEHLFAEAAVSLNARGLPPIYVPVSIQQLDADAKDGCAFADTDEDGYRVLLYGRVTEYGKSEPLPCEPSNAAFLAGIRGEFQPIPDLSDRPTAQKVTLLNGARGWFLPVSCGGSCSAASLYWQMPWASYWLQLKYSSVTPVATQLDGLLATANSLKAIPGRK